MASRKLVVELVGDSRDLERAFAKSSRAAKGFGRDMNRVSGTLKSARSNVAGAAAAIGAIAGGAVVLGIKSAVDAASSLNEEISKSQQVFGASSASILAWSETSSEALKVSQAEALAAAGNFGTMFSTIGLGERQSAQMSKALAQLGADMASFNNQDPSEMLDRLRSGLAGEAEPLRRFGVLISEARVQAEAYRSGIARTGAKLTEQQKVQARYNLILRDTQKQQGDVARTGDQFAGQMRELSARFTDMKAALGTALLPTITDLVERFNEWLETGDNQERLIKDVTGAVKFMADAFVTVKDAVAGIIDGFKRFDRYLKGWAMRVQQRMIRVALAIVTPLSHIPGALGGGPFQRARASLLANMDELRLDMRELGDKAGQEWAGSFATAAAEHLAIVNRQLAPGATPPPLAGAGRGRATPRGPDVGQRNAWFDTRIGRQLDRLQDVGLRKQLTRLKAIAAEVRARMAVTKDVTRRLNLEDKLLDILRQQRSVQAEITNQIRAANEALKERADAIKSAVLERLQRRQTDVLNRRALTDAKEQLRIAKQIGGPMGIREAARTLQDVRFDMTRARLEAAPATLTAGGRFAYGGVVININGVTDPAEVARRVAAILKRRQAQTTSQMRGKAVGAH